MPAGTDLVDGRLESWIVQAITCTPTPVNPHRLRHLSSVRQIEFVESQER